MPESRKPTARTFAPVIGEMFADSLGIKHLNESVARSVAAAAAPFNDAVAKMGAQIGANFLASFAPVSAQINAQTSAALAATWARALPAVEPLPEALFIAVQRPAMAVALDRFEAVVIREVRPVAAHTSNIDQSIASIAKAREWDRLTLILAVVSTVAVVVAAIFGVLLFTR
jgi:CelD/BcsL family acetyltransferase involved in cellulose biosynthesis